VPVIQPGKVLLTFVDFKTSVNAKKEFDLKPPIILDGKLTVASLFEFIVERCNASR